MQGSEHNIDRRFLVGAISGAAGLAAIGQIVRGGPLDPPPGPVAPTNKTLQAIYDRIARTDAGLAEPRIPVQSLAGSGTGSHVLSAPGSYYLTGNITGISGKNCIEITADNVTLNLGGYSLLGVAGSLSGIAVKGIRSGVTICGGVVRGFGAHGINCFGSDSDVADNISCLDLCLMNNGIDGLRARRAVLCVRTMASSNGGAGINVQDGPSTIVDCSANGNLQGICAFYGSVIHRCTAGSNFYEGIAPTYSGLVVSCASHYNANGIRGFGAIAVVDCNIISDRGTGLLGHFYQNLFERNSITGCPEGGIVLGNDARVVGNRVSGNGSGVGIMTDGPKSRCVIDDNTISNCTQGIVVSGANHFLTRNRCRAGSPYVIGPGSCYGPIVNVAGAGDISTIAAGSHPWANFVF